MLLESQQISSENDKVDEDNIKIQNEIKKKDGIDEQQQIIISKSLRERLQAIQETLTLLQQQGDFLVGLIDRIKGIFNFTVPFLSFLAIFSLLLITILLYYIPIRLIIIIWGKFNYLRKYSDISHFLILSSYLFTPYLDLSFPGIHQNPLISSTDFPLAPLSLQIIIHPNT
ncbi:unnamed protein product [Meloidogyne enterolobii]|uniref:Uncharacterized protein n=1 Tax=Meloidogyne enterolobii TaxID=390850 RepID=A0ACB0Z6A8_MELEN